MFFCVKLLVSYYAYFNRSQLLKLLIINNKSTKCTPFEIDIIFIFVMEQYDSSSYRSLTKLSVKLENWLMVTSVSFVFSVTTSGAISLNGSMEAAELLPFLTAS